MRKIRYQSSSRENTVLTIARKSQKDPKLAKATRTDSRENTVLTIARKSQKDPKLAKATRTDPKLTKKPKKIAKRPKTTKNFKIGEI